MRCAAIVLAGGRSLRFGICKISQNMGGTTVLDYTTNTLKKSNFFDEIIVVKDHLAGKTRQESSYNGLMQCNHPDYVLIHDASRPLVSKEILEENIKKATEHKAVNTCIPALDTINIVKKGFVDRIPDRDLYWQGQTPQTFAYDLIIRAHQSTKKINSTDDCSLVLEMGHPVYVVKGSIENMKITNPIDLKIIRALASR